MSYLNKMYGSQKNLDNTYQKNTNRVLGGLRGQGADHYSMLGEDGIERSVPTQKYVQSLEQKIREQDLRISILEKKIKSSLNSSKFSVQTFNKRLD